MYEQFMTNFSQSSQSAAYAEVMHVLSPWYGAGIKSKFLHHPLFEFFRGMGHGGVKLIFFFLIMLHVHYYHQ